VPAVQPLSVVEVSPVVRAHRAEVLLLGLAVLLGLVVTLQRQGALAALFASAGQAAGYAKLEASFGGPGFGTPRAVEALVNASAAMGASSEPAPK
jgi:hypothetical protein